MKTARPVQIYDFTAFARRTPNAPPPGDRLDAQFRQHADAINQIIAGLEQIAKPEPIDLDAIVKRVLARLEPALERSLNAARDVAALSQAAEQFARDAAAEAMRASEQARHAETIVKDMPVVEPLSTPLPAFPQLGPNTGGPYAADVEGADATAADYAQVTIAWAEHMPDTIPPNILAINAISGDHWSSRWWANRAASMFGGYLVWWYLGAYHHADAPTHTPTGDPLQPGMLYYDIDLEQMMVWNGTTWQSLGAPQAAIAASLYYLTTAGQTVFPLSTADKFGRTAALQIGQGVNVCLNGVRLTPVDDYTVSQPASTITLTAASPAGLILAVDTLILPAQLAHGVALVKSLKPLTPAPDGTRVTFTLQSADGATLSIANDAQVWISVDGVPQEPTGAYTVVGDQITFTTAPAADAYVFGVWFSP
jgi:hypothetical protein